MKILKKFMNCIKWIISFFFSFLLRSLLSFSFFYRFSRHHKDPFEADDWFSEFFYDREYADIPPFSVYSFIVDFFSLANALWPIAIFLSFFGFCNPINSYFMETAPFSICTFIFSLLFPYLVAAFSWFFHKYQIVPPISREDDLP